MTTSSHISTAHSTYGRHARGLKDIHALKDKQNDSGQDIDMGHYHIPQPPLPPLPLPPLPPLPLLVVPLLPLLPRPLPLVAAAAASHSSL